MKMKFTRPDGSIAEVEGTPEECSAFALALSPSKPVEVSEESRRALREAFQKAVEEVFRGLPQTTFWYNTPIFIPYAVPYVPYTVPYQPAFPVVEPWTQPFWYSAPQYGSAGIHVGDSFPGTTLVTSDLASTSSFNVDPSVPLVSSSYELKPTDQIWLTSNH